MNTAFAHILQRNLSLLSDETLFLFGFIQGDYRSIFPDKTIVGQSRFFNQSDQHIAFVDKVSKIGGQAIYLWGKNKRECFFDLCQYLSLAPIGERLLIVGENNAGVKSVVKMLAPFGEVVKIDSAAHCTLYCFSLAQAIDYDINHFWHQWHYGDLIVQGLTGVFHCGGVDQGTQVLLEGINSEHISGKVLDVGAGCGIIGAFLKQRNHAITLSQSDIHSSAIASIKRTLSANHLQAEVRVSDVFSHIQGRFDCIISNPPFHNGRNTDYEPTLRLIAQSPQFLTACGTLYLVANAHLPYGEALGRSFAHVAIISVARGFKLYKAWGRRSPHKTPAR